MKPADPPKPPDHPTPAELTQQQVDATKRNEPISQVDAKRAAIAHGDRIDSRDATSAELEASTLRRAAETDPTRAALLRRDPSTLTAAERDILARQPLVVDQADASRRADLLKRPAETLTQAERDWLLRYPTSSPDADALAARNQARAAITVVDDQARVALIHQVDGRTTTIARELEGDAAVLEQLAAQLRLDARDLRVVTPAQTAAIDVSVARLRAFAAQLVMLCASRDVPLPQVPTLPAPPHVPPARA